MQLKDKSWSMLAEWEIHFWCVQHPFWSDKVKNSHSCVTQVFALCSDIPGPPSVPALDKLQLRRTAALKPLLLLLMPMRLNFHHPAEISDIVARVNHKDTEEWIISESGRLCAGICSSWHDFICDSSTPPCKRGLRKEGEGAWCAAVSVDVGGEINLSESLTSITLKDAGDGGRGERKEGWKTYLDARALKRCSALFEITKEAYTTATCA